jgi:hypothetical protein
MYGQIRLFGEVKVATRDGQRIMNISASLGGRHDERETVVTLRWSPRYIREAASFYWLRSSWETLTVPRQTITEFHPPPPPKQMMCTGHTIMKRGTRMIQSQAHILIAFSFQKFM